MGYCSGKSPRTLRNPRAADEPLVSRMGWETPAVQGIVLVDDSAGQWGWRATRVGGSEGKDEMHEKVPFLLHPCKSRGSAGL